MFTPLLAPGVNTLYCLEEWRGEQRISTPGNNFNPLGYNFAPWVKVSPRGEVMNGPQFLKTGKNNA
jgi:hypothetical protein